MAPGEIDREQYIDPERFIDELRGQNRELHWVPRSPDVGIEGLSRQPVLDEESLRYLHANWGLPDDLQAPEVNSGVRGRFDRYVTRLIVRLLGRRLAAEQDVIVHLVRMVDHLARRCDALTESLAAREVEEAASQARLAAWLHAEPPAGPRPIPH